MGVSHTPSKRVLQVQTAVNPESCCLWFAFSPQHFALQTQQLCRRVFETAGTPLSGQCYPEMQWRSPKCAGAQATHSSPSAACSSACVAGAKGMVQAHLTVHCQQVARSHLQEQSNHGFVTLRWTVSEICCTAGIVCRNGKACMQGKGCMQWYIWCHSNHALSCSRTWYAV